MIRRRVPTGWYGLLELSTAASCNLFHSHSDSTPDSPPLCNDEPPPPAQWGRAQPNR